jgi:hypothetical protein
MTCVLRGRCAVGALSPNKITATSPTHTSEQQWGGVPLAPVYHNKSFMYYINNTFVWSLGGVDPPLADYCMVYKGKI